MFFTWEAIESGGPGIYDEEWIQHTIEILRLAKSYGFYIFMDPHQDVWSRFSGGSGAPMWTLYACGLDPEKFAVTEAAVVHNTYPDPENFPKMIWSTNYTRLHVRLYLRSSLPVETLRRSVSLMVRISKITFKITSPIEDLWVGQMFLPFQASRKLQKGTSPTAFQAMLTGSGRACEIDTWDFGGMGPYKSGRVLVDPQGETAWLPVDYDESRYSYKRDPGWKLGECIWAQHESTNRGKKLVMKSSQIHITWITIENTEMLSGLITRTQFCFVSHQYWKYLHQIKGTKDDDPLMVYAPHYYDGVTLMTKKWNRYWNVDVFGILRGRYLSPAFAIKIGETAIRNCFRGINFRLSKKRAKTIWEIIHYAYKTGDYSSQSGAMDANHYAIEGSAMAGYTLWLYMCENKHSLGDQWNGEDLSIFSLDDLPLPLEANPSTPSESSSSLVDHTTGPNTKKQNSDESTVNPGNLKATLKTPQFHRSKLIALLNSRILLVTELPKLTFARPLSQQLERF
ncbi:hypothetical protein EYC84_009136 [Monilinia fructicola]|uniref:Glycoside hydrolase family 5 domain-containing protein n=1 Tax=Monilinia fructicola TaxID=38448 RepID=A0A5M9JDA1_MONFR|nr:hypothetical protein EYC84_009136 [Monilinia fructicola]